ncbi:baseplate J/gp47 family protein [Candidatus Pacearchaeota archaeon]|nr:baseplate J/gp47 family protein [Candidatus Pacearchaeota archaeon]
MAVTIPTLEELTDQILQDIATEFGVDVSELGTTYIVAAKVQAGIIYQQYLALSGVQKNIFYDLAEESILIRYGSIILGRTPSPAEAGEYEVEVIGQIGAIITAATQFKANDNALAAGLLFVVDQDFTLTAEIDTLPLRALTPGIEASLFVDDLLTSTSPIVNVNSEVKVTAITKAPVSAESIESYRADVIEAAKIEPQGGSPGDFRLWCSEIPEIRKTYPFAKSGSPGDIEIYIEATEENTAPSEITGVPTQATIDEVYTAQIGATPESGIVVINPITAKGRKPISVFTIFPLPVNPISVDLDFTGLSDESIAPSIKTAIDALLYDIRPFVAGADLITNKKDILTIGQVIAIVITVLSGTGITYTTLDMLVDGNIVNEFQFLLGNYPYLRFVNNDGNPI